MAEGSTCVGRCGEQYLPGPNMGRDNWGLLAKTFKKRGLDIGGAVQAHPIEPPLNAPGTGRIKL